MSFVPIKNLLPNIITSQPREDDVFRYFNQLIADNKLYPLYIKDGLLVICSLDANNLGGLKEQDILDRINRKFGSEVLRGIRRVG